MDDRDGDVNNTPDAAAVALLPEGIARTLRCVPLSASGRTLTLAVAAPLSGDQLRSLIEITGRDLVAQAELGPGAVDRLIEEAYGTDSGSSSQADVSAA